MNEIGNKLGLRAVPDRWHAEWERSCRSMPADGLPFLREETLREADQAMRLPAGAMRALMEAAALVRSDPELALLVWHGCRMLFDPEADPDPNPYGQYIPDLSARLEELADLYVPLVLMGGFRQTAERCRERGIPQAVLEATLSDMRIWMNEYHQTHGRWGQANFWLYYHLSFRLFRLGRMQFCRDRFRGCVRVYRNRESKETVALAEPGVRFRGDGRIDGTNGRFDPEGAWESVLAMNKTEIRGNPVSAAGGALQETVTLPAADWEPVLSPGEPVLDVHIPGDGKLDPVQVGESLAQAIDFFARYFPEFGYRAFSCTSWLLDPHFRQMLPPDSNIVSFQKLFIVYPTSGGGRETLNRIFGRQFDDWSQAPRDTALRRAVLDHLAAGGELNEAGGFILRQ